MCSVLRWIYHPRVGPQSPLICLPWTGLLPALQETTSLDKALPAAEFWSAAENRSLMPSPFLTQFYAPWSGVILPMAQLPSRQ